MSSILRSKIIDILNASVGQYCHGIDKDHISVSVFNGEVRISDLAIKQDCFIHHGLPFSVSAGRVGSLIVLIPWASLSSQPIEIFLSDLVLDVCDSDVDAEGLISKNLDARAAKAREESLAVDTSRRVAVLRARSSGISDQATAELGRMGALIAGAVKNLSCSLKNLTIRYTARDGSSFVFHIDSVDLMNVDENLKQAFLSVHSVTRKCCLVDGLSLLATTRSLPSAPVLQPISAKLIMSFENGAEARLLVGDLSVCLDSDMVPVLADVAAAGRLRVAQSRCAAARPAVPIRGNTRAWWGYVTACVKTMIAPQTLKIKRMSRKLSLCLKDYCGVYIKVLVGDDIVDASLLSRLRAMEADLQPDLIFRFRDRCAAIVESKGLLARKSQAASPGGWFSWVSAAPKQSFLSEDEIQALSELSFSPDALVLQRDAAQPSAAAPNTSVGYTASFEFESFTLNFLDRGCPSFYAAVSSFSASVSYVGSELSASCVLHRLDVCESNPSKRGHHIASSSLQDSDGAHQLSLSIAASPSSTSITGNVSGIDINLDDTSLALLSRWLEQARVMSMHSTSSDPVASAHASSVSLKLVAMHIQRSPQIDVFISWQAPTIKLQAGGSALCLFLGNLTLKSLPVTDSDLSPDVSPPLLHSTTPHFFPASAGSYPCPSAIYHRFDLTLIDFTLGLFDASDLATDPKRARSDESFQRIIAPSSAQLSLSLVRGEFADQHWPFAQVSANCDSVSFEICPRYCLAINAAILMTMKLLSQSQAVSHADIAEHDFSRAISSYIHVEEDDAGSTDTASVPAVLLLFVSSVSTVSVRIVGRDQSQSDCSLVFTSSKTSLVIHPDDVDAYMSVMQVTCLNNLLPENSPSRVILSINGGTSQAGSLLHFWFAEKGSSLWSGHTAIADKTIFHTGPSLFLSLDCADAEFNADMFRYQGLIDLFSSNLDVFSVSIKEDLSRKMESLIAEVKSKMSKTGSTFTFEGNFSKLFAKLLTGSNSVSVLSAELNHSSVKLVFSGGSTIDFCVSSDAFKLHDCITSESVAPQTIIESSSSQSLQVHGSISGETLSVTAKLSTFQSKLFAPAVAAIWRLLFPPSATSPDVRAVSTSAASPTRFLSISLVFEGAQILFCDHFSSESGFRLTAPTMNLSCIVQGEGLTTVELLEGAEAFCIDAVVNDTVTQVMRSDGSVCLKLQPSRYDLCCPVKNLSLFVSDRLLDYAIPFVRDVLGSAVALLNAEEIVDRIIQQHVGQDFCITTGAKSLRLHLGDSSPSQHFIPLFESGDLSISDFSQVEAIDATSKMDVVNAMHDGKASRLIELETNVASVEARVSFQGKQFRVLSSSKSSSNVFSFGGTVVSAIEQSSYSGDLKFSAGFILLQIDEQSFSLFIRVFANMFSAMSSAKAPCRTAQVSATPAAAYYCIGFNAAFAGLSVELCLNDTISGRYSSKMNVSGSLSQDSFKIVSKWEDTTVAFLQRIANGEQSTIQELLERTSFNFTFKSDFSSFEHSAMLSFSSPIVCNTSYTDIKRFYSTFEMFYASFKAGFKASRLPNSSPSPTVSVAATSQSKLNVCVQADCLQLVFVNDCPPFCAPLLQLQLSKLSLDTCISIVARGPQVSWLKSSMSIALNHCINEATSCDDLISAKKEIVFEEYSFSVSSQLLPNDGFSESQVVADKSSSHCQHIRFEASSLFEANISQACVMSLVTAFARMHRDWSLWMRCKVPSVSVADHDSASSPSIELAPLSRDLSAHRFVFMCMRNETNTVIAVSHRGMPPIVLPPQCDVSLDDSWTNLEFTLHANDRSKVCVVTHVSILMEVGGHWIHIQSEERTGQQFVVFRGNLQIFNHTSISVSMATAGSPAPLVLEPRQATTARFRLSTFCVSMLGRTELTFSIEKRSICLSFDESSANSFTSQLEGASSTVRILGSLFAGVMVIRILPLLSIESSLPMTVSVLLSHQPNGSDFCSTSVHPHDLIDVCSASLARDVWLATTSESSDSHHSPSFTPLFSSALSSCASPSLASSSVILQCASLRHILSISLRIDEYGVPVISIFVSFVIKNCTHLLLDASLTNQPADSLEISTCRTSCPPQHDGQPTVSVLGTDKPLFSVDHFQHLSLSLKVPGSSKNASALSLAGFEDSVMWLACSVQSDGGSCDLALCFEPHNNQGTLITIRYRTLFYNHTQLPFSFAVDPALDVFTAVLPSCHAYLKEYTQPCQAVVRLHYQDGLHTQVSSLIPLVSPSNHALSLVIPTADSGAVEQTFYLRIFEDNGTIIASLCDSGDVQSSILVSNETHNLDAFVSLSPSFQDKRIVCSGSTVNVNTPDPSQSCSLRVTFRAAGSAPGAPSAECSIQVNDVGKHESVSFSGRTVHVYIEPRHGMRHVVIAEKPPLSPLFIIGSLVPRISFELDVPGIGLSCIDAEGCELFYFRLEHVWFRWQAAEEEAVELKIVNMQVDGPLCCGPDVIISRVSRPSAAPVDGKTKPTLPVVHAVIVRSSSQWSREVARVDLLRSATICVQELRVDLHEAVIYKLLAFLQPFSSTASEIIALNSEVASAADEKIVLKRVQRQLSVTHAQLLFVRQLMIHSVSCLLSFSLASNSEQILADRRKFLKMGRSKLTKTLLDVVGIGGIREAKVNINSLRIENLFAPRQQLISVLKTFFQSQLKAGALSFLGSLDALGNPKHLLMGYASAVSDIFIEPATSAVLSPKDIVSSMRHGTTSLIHNVVGSSLGSIASVSDAFSRGISSVTGNDRVHEASKIRSAGEGLKHGAKSLGMGFLSGITGVVTKPMEGARGGGGGFSIGGLMKGMASGIVGVVAEPVKGMADMISDVGKGIDSSTARLHGHKSVERLRAARPPSRWLTMPYNDTAAVASTFVRLWQGSATPRPLVAVVFDLIGHRDWRYSVLALHRPGLRDFSLLNLSELQELCKAKKLSTTGNHRTLMDRLTLSQPEELLFGHLRLDYTLSSDRWHVPFGKENLGFTHAEGSEVLLQGDSNHRKSVKCLSHADAVAVANFIAKAELNLPLSEQEETLCFRCKGHH